MNAHVRKSQGSKLSLEQGSTLASNPALPPPTWGQAKADELCLDEIAAQCSLACHYLELASTHASIGDRSGVIYDFGRAVMHTKLAGAAIKDMREREIERAVAAHVAEAERAPEPKEDAA